MADIRINSLPTTASASSSDDFLALDGATNGTRKLNAYSPTFGGNLTVSGTGSISRGFATGAANTNGDISLTINGNASIGTAARWINQASSAANNWQIGTNLTGNWLSFMPSTAADGTTFSTDAFKLTPAGNATLAGNLTVSGTTIGLGVTPSAWDGTLIKAIQLADNGASLSSFSTGNTSNKFAILSNNAYYDSGGWKYLQTAGTAQYRVANQEHLWYSAASGTAGNAITFTERMKLDSSGNLTVSGTGTSSFAGNVAVTGTGTNYTAIDTGSFVKFGNDQTSANLQVGSKSGVGAILQGAAGGSVSYPLVAQPFGGNLLVGTTTDGGQKLQVAGDAIIGVQSGGTSSTLSLNTGGSNRATITADASYLTINSITSNPMRLQTNGTTALTLDSSQNATFVGKIIVSGTANSYIGGVGLNSNDSALTVNTNNANKYALKLSNWDGTATSYAPRIFFDNSGRNSWFVGAVNASSAFTITENTTDVITIASGGATTFVGAIAIGNTVNTVSPTNPNRTITMVIGGTTYYIHAKTTND